MNGWTALHEAAYSGQLEVARLLVESGADRAAKTNSGETARDHAVLYNHTAVAALLQ